MSTTTHKMLGSPTGNPEAAYYDTSFNGLTPTMPNVRVEPGSYLPSAPTDPGEQISCTRFLGVTVSPFAIRRCCVDTFIGSDTPPCVPTTAP